MANIWDPEDRGAFINEDWLWLDTVQDLLRIHQIPSCLDEALQAMRNVPEIEDAWDNLNNKVQNFQDRYLSQNYLARDDLPVGMEFRRVPGLESYNHDFAKAIYVYSLDKPPVFRIVNGLLNNRKDRCGLGPRVMAIAPYVKFLQAALEALPPELRFVGTVTKAQRHGFRTGDGVPVEAKDRFPIGRSFYRFAFMSSSKFPMDRIPTFFLDMTKPEDPGHIYQINVGEEAAAYDIDLFNHFTLLGKSEGEVLFDLLARWTVREETQRQAVTIAGKNVNPIIIKVDLTRAPRCHFCLNKVHNRLREHKPIMARPPEIQGEDRCTQGVVLWCDVNANIGKAMGPLEEDLLIVLTFTTPEATLAAFEEHGGRVVAVVSSMMEGGGRKERGEMNAFRLFEQVKKRTAGLIQPPLFAVCTGQQNREKEARDEGCAFLVRNEKEAVKLLQTAISRRGQVVLCCDRNPKWVWDHTDFLRRKGYKVEVYGDAQECIAAYERQKNIMLPSGRQTMVAVIVSFMGGVGLTVFQEIHKRSQGKPPVMAIASTGEWPPEHRASAFRAGATFVISEEPVWEKVQTMIVERIERRV